MDQTIEFMREKTKKVEDNVENYIDADHKIKSLEVNASPLKAAAFTLVGVHAIAASAWIATLNTPSSNFNIFDIYATIYLACIFPLGAISILEAEQRISKNIKELTNSKADAYKKMTKLEKNTFRLPNVSYLSNSYEDSNKSIKKFSRTTKFFKNSAFVSLGAACIGITMLKNSTGLQIYPFENLEMFPAIALTIAGSVFSLLNLIYFSNEKTYLVDAKNNKQKFFRYLPIDEQEDIIKKESSTENNPLDKIHSLRKNATKNMLGTTEQPIKNNL